MPRPVKARTRFYLRALLPDRMRAPVWAVLWGIGAAWFAARAASEPPFPAPASPPENEPPELPTVLVLAAPFAASNPNLPFRGTVLERDSLESPPQRSLDGVLRDIPGFRLFRRTDSLGAHPTSQGMSLTNVGPNGASRSVILLDGVPLNDPFGGWVPWSRLPAALIHSAHLQPQAGVSPWGTGSLGGALALESRVLSAPAFQMAEFAAGNRLQYQGSSAFAIDTNAARTRLFGSLQTIRFKGYPVIEESQRGQVDIPAKMRSESFDAGLRHAFSEARDWHLTLRAMGWREARNAGTPLTNNQSRALDLSLRLTHDSGPGENASETIVFGQQRAFSSFFTSVSADRARETPSLDQYAVPSWSWGAIERLRLVVSETHTLSTGADIRLTEGRTREYYRYQQNAFTGQREAGGRQMLAGIYLQDVWKPDPLLQLSTGIRLDVQREYSGALRETPTRGSAPGTHTTYPARNALLPHSNFSLEWTPSRRMAWMAAVYSGSRAPTLNELYRPFRAGDISTLANPALEPESLTGCELQLRLKPLPRTEWTFRGFANSLQNAVNNLSRVRGPGTFPPWGYLAPGVSGARRENIERARISGFETRLEWKPSSKVSLQGSWLLTDSEVRRSNLAPELVGKALPQIPRSQLSVQVRGSEGPWNAALSVRHCGSQFEDDSNRLKLASFWTADARVGRLFGTRSEVFLSAENLANAQIQTRRDASGILAVGMPRLWCAGVRLEF